MPTMDLTEKKSPCVVDVIENKKCCSDCNTTRTPLWRGGPAGPKSLCNACGIRYRKRRRAMLDSNKSPEKKPKRGGGGSQSNTPINTASSSSSSNSVTVASNDTAVSNSRSENSNGLNESFTMRLMAFGDEVFLTPVIVKKQRCQRRRKLKEEEEAAFSLIALSCGSLSVLA